MRHVIRPESGIRLRLNRRKRTQKPGSPVGSGNPGFYRLSLVRPWRAEVTPLYALNELPQPQVVLACGILDREPRSLHAVDIVDFRLPEAAARSENP